MAISIGTSGNAWKTQAVKIGYKDFGTVTGAANQTVKILENGGGSISTVLRNVTCYCTQSWAADAITCAVGLASDVDRYVAAVTSSSGDAGMNNGAAFVAGDVTVTTAGTNSGTSGAGLSLLPTLKTGKVVDDDAAATNGTDVNIVPDSNGVTGYFESVLANNATVLASVDNAGAGGEPTFQVVDNDTPGGVALYFDEDAADADSRFLAVNALGADLFVPTSDGGYIRVKHDASAASNGVIVHCDDDAANIYDRLLFVSPTDTDGTYTLDDTVAQAPYHNLIQNDLLALQEDIAALEPLLDGAMANQGRAEVLTTGAGIQATLTTDGTNWSDLTAGEFIVIAEYIDLSELSDLV